MTFVIWFAIAGVVLLFGSNWLTTSFVGSEMEPICRYGSLFGLICIVIAGIFFVAHIAGAPV